MKASALLSFVAADSILFMTGTDDDDDVPVTLGVGCVGRIATSWAIEELGAGTG